MHPARIAELLEPFLAPAYGQRRIANDRSEPALSRAKGLTDNDLAHISTYIDILVRWNTRINLTAIRDEDDIVTRHFGESFFAARHLFSSTTRVGAGASPVHAEQSAAVSIVNPGQQQPNREGHDFSRANGREGIAWALAPEGHAVANDCSEPALREAKGPTANDRVSLADIGSGAGFPGIPIKLWAPQIYLTLIESNHKKATFLREVARALTLTDINIQTTRAEELLKLPHPQKEPEQNFRPPFDVVTLRAVERFPDILPIAAALVARGGRLALLVGTPQQAQAEALCPSLHWLPPTPIPLSKSRTLLIGTREPEK